MKHQCVRLCKQRVSVSAFSQVAADDRALRTRRCFSETWGPPYDPNSYTASWKVADEAHYAAIPNTTPEEQAARTALFADISNVVTIENEVARQEKWAEILTAVHASAINLPFSGKRNPTVLNKRLTGYTPGQQQFDYPLHTLVATTGDNSIVVAPGAQTGLFTTVGRLDPHTYRPNEFFANNWVYEGLVKYGANGVIEPALAASWVVADIAGTDDQRYTFTLRSGVTFHDGTAWNCGAAKLNFDHVLAPPLTTGDWHGWYDLPTVVKNWACPAGDATGLTFTLETTGKYYPLLQELSLIRPLRMLSPASFVGGASSDPLTQNSCHVGWNPEDGSTIDGNGASLTCAGITAVSGTGPWTYDNTAGTTYESDGETVDFVTFNAFANYWGGAPSVGSVKVQRYADSAAVKAALIDGTLDVVIGSGVLAPADLRDLQQTQTATLSVYVGPVIQNRVIILNGNLAPTDDIEVRKAIIHAVDKAAIIDRELAGFAEAEDSLFPRNAPYCDVDLTPRWDFDLQKAKFINCPASPTEVTVVADDDDDAATVAWAVAAVFAFLLIVCAAVMFKVGKKKGVDEYLLQENTGPAPAVKREDP